MSETKTPADPTPKIAYTVIEYVDAAQLKADLAFSLNNLSNANMQQASLIAHYGILHAKAMKQTATVEMLLENTRAVVYRKSREDLIARGEKFTEPMLESMVTRNTSVNAMRTALNEARQVEAIAKIAVESFRHRRDMLIQEGVKAREEMKGELYIAGQQAMSETLAAQRDRYLQRAREKSEETQ